MCGVCVRESEHFARTERERERGERDRERERDDARQAAICGGGVRERGQVGREREGKRQQSPGKRVCVGERVKSEHIACA